MLFLVGMAFSVAANSVHRPTVSDTDIGVTKVVKTDVNFTVNVVSNVVFLNETSLVFDIGEPTENAYPLPKSEGINFKLTKKIYLLNCSIRQC